MRKIRRRRRWFAFILLLLVLILFYRSAWLGRIIYPIDYRQVIEGASENSGLDPFLVAAVIRVESNYRPDQESSKGAIGIMQVMPDTAQWIIERGELGMYELTDLKDPKVNIAIGTAYLALLHQQFEQNQIKAVASYNAGPGNVTKWLSNGIWDGRMETIDEIPFGETRKYVAKVMYYYKKYTEIYADS